jgi:hypothetical protein
MSIMVYITGEKRKRFTDNDSTICDVLYPLYQTLDTIFGRLETLSQELSDTGGIDPDSHQRLVENVEKLSVDLNRANGSLGKIRAAAIDLSWFVESSTDYDQTTTG